MVLGTSDGGKDNVMMDGASEPTVVEAISITGVDVTMTDEGILVGTTLGDAEVNDGTVVGATDGVSDGVLDGVSDGVSDGAAELDDSDDEGDVKTAPESSPLLLHDTVP
jgi:hypothetical protein